MYAARCFQYVCVCVWERVRWREGNEKETFTGQTFVCVQCHTQLCVCVCVAVSQSPGRITTPLNFSCIVQSAPFPRSSLSTLVSSFYLYLLLPLKHLWPSSTARLFFFNVSPSCLVSSKLPLCHCQHSLQYLSHVSRAQCPGWPLLRQLYCFGCLPSSHVLCAFPLFFCTSSAGPTCLALTQQSKKREKQKPWLRSRVYLIFARQNLVLGCLTAFSVPVRW